MIKCRSKNTAVKKFVNMAMSCFLSHSSKCRGGCGDSRGMTGLFRLGECNDSITTHLNTCHLSRESMTEFDLILTRAGVFELPLPKVNEMMICPKQRRPCQYPTHHGGRKTIKSRDVANVDMAREIRRTPRSNCASRPCQYPMHHGGRKTIKSRDVAKNSTE